MSSLSLNLTLQCSLGCAAVESMSIAATAEGRVTVAKRSKAFSCLQAELGPAAASRDLRAAKEVLGLGSKFSGLGLRMVLILGSVAQASENVLKPAAPAELNQRPLQHAVSSTVKQAL